MPKIPFDLNVRLYRLIGGGKMAGSTLLLYTRDPDTGKQHTVQIDYAPDGQNFLVVPRGTPDKLPDWYRNAAADPRVEVQVGGRRFPARAQVVSPEEREQVWTILTGAHGDYNETPQESMTPLPFVRLTPT